MKTEQHKSFSQPDEERTFPHGKVELVKINGGTVGRLVLQPGWRWSVDVKPVAGTPLCEAPHFQYIVSGSIGVKMADGSEHHLGPGDVSWLPSGHDAWVIGGEPFVAVDWQGATHYAEKT